MQFLSLSRFQDGPHCRLAVFLTALMSLVSAALLSTPTMAIMPGGGSGGYTSPIYYNPARRNSINEERERRARQQADARRVQIQHEAEHARQQQMAEAQRLREAEARIAAARPDQERVGPKDKEEADVSDPVAELKRIPGLLSEMVATQPTQKQIEVSQYLNEFTAAFLAKREAEQTTPSGVWSWVEWMVGSRKASTPKSFTPLSPSTSGQECPLCLDTLEEDEITLACGHGFHHLDCLGGHLASRLQAGDAIGLTQCPLLDCKKQISAAELASLTIDLPTALRIQKLLVRTLPEFRLCPSCSGSIAKENQHLGWHYECHACKKDLCFGCGRAPHSGQTCAELNSRDAFKKNFIVQALKDHEDEQWGLCPHCGILVGRSAGCGDMTCGENAADKKQIGGAVSDRGCGKRYQWNAPLTKPVYIPARIKLPQALQAIDQSTFETPAAEQSASAEAPAQHLGPEMPRQQFNEHILRLARSLRLTAYDEVLGDYPIHAAILRGEYSLIDRLLLNYGVDLNTTGRTGSTPLHLALDFAQARDQDRMLQLLFRGSVYEGTPPLDLNLLSPLGNTVLHRIAAHLGTAERVKTLRSLFHSYHRLDINGEDREGHTALHLAARNFTSDHADEEQHQLEAIDLLLRQGADPNRRVHGLSALDFAAAGNHWSLARLLLQHGASPVKYKRGGWTLKHHLKYLRMRARKEFVAVGGNPIVFVTRRD